MLRGMSSEIGLIVMPTPCWRRKAVSGAPLCRPHSDADARRARVDAEKGPVADAWVLYGVLDGTESLERFERVDDVSRPGHAEVKLASVTTGSQGKVDLVAPRAIHAEQGGPTRSVAIIVRSQKLGEGTVLQHQYDRAANTVVERYGPTQVPYEIAG